MAYKIKQPKVKEKKEKPFIVGDEEWNIREGNYGKVYENKEGEVSYEWGSIGNSIELLEKYGAIGKIKINWDNKRSTIFENKTGKNFTRYDNYTTENNKTTYFKKFRKYKK